MSNFVEFNVDYTTNAFNVQSKYKLPSKIQIEIPYPSILQKKKRDTSLSLIVNYSLELKSEREILI